MHQPSLRIIAVVAIALVTTLAGPPRARAGGAVAIDSCRTLTDANTTYKLTTDLDSCGRCLVVAADQITIDLQGHSITSTCPGNDSAIIGVAQDLIVVKNGSITGYHVGVNLDDSTRVSVLGVTANDNNFAGMLIGRRGLVKSSEASRNGGLGIAVGSHGQVQQCTVNDNGHGDNGTGGIVADDNCLITMNIANSNGGFGGIVTSGNKCTVSYNAAHGNAGVGINAGAFGGTGNLVTRNTAINNADVDFAILCPSDVTNNTSSGGSYSLIGPGCHFVNNF